MENGLISFWEVATYLRLNNLCLC